jgi:hypothetical protein
MSVVPAIPAKQIVAVNPSVLSAGGDALDLIGVMLTDSTRPPIGTILSFANSKDAGAYFGSTSQMAALAAIYFLGFDNSNRKPGQLLVTQYARVAVGAYLRGGNISGLSLTALQAMNDTLSVVIDGVTKSGTVNLATATSPSSAAQIVGDVLDIEGAQQAAINGSITGTTLTVGTLTSGTLAAGQILNGTGVTAGTYITVQLTGTAGGVGTYTVSTGQTAAVQAITARAPGVVYDSVSGALVVSSRTTGTGSSIGYATGALSGSLMLTQGSGAVLSQGAAATDPATFMNAIIATTQNWASFMTTWEPSEADKIAFATWNNGQNNSYVYEMWDTNTINTGPTGPSTAAAAIVLGNFSGVNLIHEEPALNLFGGEFAAFQMGVTASIDFTQTEGRITFAFRRQTGLTPQITNGTVAQYLISYGFNFYGDYTTANQAFKWWQKGTITGPFLWKDSYVNQIWFNNQLQLAGMVLFDNAFSVAYNRFGYARVEAALADPIGQAVDFGAIRVGVTLSAAQIAAVNSSAGVKIDGVLVQRGWYVQVKDALPQVRAVRGSPPTTVWYTDGQSIQQLNIGSVEIQ